MNRNLLLTEELLKDVVPDEVYTINDLSEAFRIRAVRIAAIAQAKGVLKKNPIGTACILGRDFENILGSILTKKRFWRNPDSQIRNLTKALSGTDPEARYPLARFVRENAVPHVYLAARKFSEPGSNPPIVKGADLIDVLRRSHEWYKRTFKLPPLTGQEISARIKSLVPGRLYKVAELAGLLPGINHEAIRRCLHRHGALCPFSGEVGLFVSGRDAAAALEEMAKRWGEILPKVPPLPEIVPVSVPSARIRALSCLPSMARFGTTRGSFFRVAGALSLFLRLSREFDVMPRNLARGLSGALARKYCASYSPQFNTFMKLLETDALAASLFEEGHDGTFDGVTETTGGEGT